MALAYDDCMAVIAKYRGYNRRQALAVDLDKVLGMLPVAEASELRAMGLRPADFVEGFENFEEVSSLIGPCAGSVWKLLKGASSGPPPSQGIRITPDRSMTGSAMGSASSNQRPPAPLRAFGHRWLVDPLRGRLASRALALVCSINRSMHVWGSRCRLLNGAGCWRTWRIVMEKSGPSRPCSPFTSSLVRAVQSGWTAPLHY